MIYVQPTDMIRIGEVTATGREWLAKWKSAPPPTKTQRELAEENLQELVDYFTINGADYCSKYGNEYGDGSFVGVSFGCDLMAALKPLDKLGASAPRAGFKVTLAEAAASEADDEG